MSLHLGSSAALVKILQRAPKSNKNWSLLVRSISRHGRIDEDAAGLAGEGHHSLPWSHPSD